VMCKIKRLNRLFSRLAGEGGQALATVLILMMVGSLTLPPVLAQIGTALETGQIYETRTNELYTADSGVEDAIWNIKYDRLNAIFDEPEYDVYDFETTWEYTLHEVLNGLSANVTIENVWIPRGITPMNATEATEMIESNKLMVAGTSPDEDSYQIKITFTPGEDEGDLLMVETIGIWLPLGFTYVNGSSNLEQDPADEYYSVPTVQDYNGGQSVVWEFESVPFTSFPGVDSESVPMITEINFDYTPAETGTVPVAISWTTTSGLSDVPMSWDIDSRIYKIVSTCGSTEIEAYSARCELRKMDAAIAGDYRAIGNSLMQDNYYPYTRRDTLLSESTTELSSVPNDPNDDVGEVIKAYLYWSGFKDDGFTSAIWYDDCNDLNDWEQSGSVWGIYSGRFSGHFSGNEEDRYLSMLTAVDLSGYSEGEAAVEWDQAEYGSLESSDRLQFQLSGDDGATWSDMITAFADDIGTSWIYYHYVIPEEYLTSQFKMRFYLDSFAGYNEYAYVNDFAVAEITGEADTTCTFKIDGTQVYLDGDNEPQTGAGEITATRTQVLGNKNRGEYSYSSFRDVTKLVREYAEIIDDEYPTGNAEYTVGSVDGDTGTEWSYAGWSLIVVFSSMETAGHQLYLYDTFAFSGGNDNLDFDFDGEPGGDISGFVVPEPIEGEEIAATVTVFIGEGDDCYTGDYFIFNGEALSDGFTTSDVWNSRSLNMSEPGVDIDTFYITWDSGLVIADDTEAHIDVPTGTDNWNLIYIILSVRSETITGGTTHYVIRDN